MSVSSLLLRSRVLSAPFISQLFMTEEIPETVWADFVKIASSGDFDFERRLFS